MIARRVADLAAVTCLLAGLSLIVRALAIEAHIHTMKELMLWSQLS